MRRGPHRRSDDAAGSGTLHAARCRRCGIVYVGAGIARTSPMRAGNQTHMQRRCTAGGLYPHSPHMGARGRYSRGLRRPGARRAHKHDTTAAAGRTRRRPADLALTSAGRIGCSHGAVENLRLGHRRTGHCRNTAHSGCRSCTHGRAGARGCHNIRRSGNPHHTLLGKHATIRRTRRHAQSHAHNRAGGSCKRPRNGRAALLLGPVCRCGRRCSGLGRYHAEALRRLSRRGYGSFKRRLRQVGSIRVRGYGRWIKGGATLGRRGGCAHLFRAPVLLPLSRCSAHAHRREERSRQRRCGFSAHACRGKAYGGICPSLGPCIHSGDCGIRAAGRNSGGKSHARLCGGRYRLPPRLWP